MRPDDEVQQSPASSIPFRPQLSHTSDNSTSQRVYVSMPQPMTPHRSAPVRLVPGSASSTLGTVRMVSQSSQSLHSQRNTVRCIPPEGSAQTVLADLDTQEEAANVAALREKVREALAQQGQTPNVPAPPVCGGMSSPRRGVGTSWHSQVHAGLQGQQQVPPRTGGGMGSASTYSSAALPAGQARGIDIYMASSGGTQSSGNQGSYVGTSTGSAQSPPAPQRTHSPVAMHRGLSPVRSVAIRQHAIPRTLSPVRTMQL